MAQQTMERNSLNYSLTKTTPNLIPIKSLIFSHWELPLRAAGTRALRAQLRGERRGRACALRTFSRT